LRQVLPLVEEGFELQALKVARFLNDLSHSFGIVLQLINLVLELLRHSLHLHLVDMPLRILFLLDLIPHHFELPLLEFKKLVFGVCQLLFEF
jgi:hypothetical protein